METCVDCKHHEVISDRDPDDWFCDDDKAVICILTPNPNINPESKYLADHSNFRSVAVACRPYKIREDAIVPEWCPLKNV